MVSTHQPTLELLGSQFVQAHIRGNAQANETQHVEIGVSFAVLP
jgi:hypothetical protein